MNTHTHIYSNMTQEEENLHSSKGNETGLCPNWRVVKVLKTNPGVCYLSAGKSGTKERNTDEYSVQ